MYRLQRRLYTHLIAAMTFLLFSSQLVGISALRLHPAGNSSFSTLDDSSFWLSDQGNFTFGFQALDGGEDHLLSIWHSQDPNKTAIWWVGPSSSASPLIKAGATLRFTSTGSLQLYSAPSNASLLWSSNTSSSYAGLEDTGNLVLFATNKEKVLWQSFDSSRDSLMLAEVEVDASRVSNKPHLLQSRENALSYAAGRFHVATDEYLNVYLHALDSFGQDFVYIYANINTSGEFQIGRDYGKQFSSTSGKQRSQRLTLDYDGNLRVYMWASNVSSWQQVWQFLDDKCMLGSPCGPFGICMETPAAAANGSGAFNCTCPPGYRPRKTGDVSQGCQAISISFNASCGTGYTNNYKAVMKEFPFSDYSYNDLASQPHQSIDECKALCLKDCACMAASYRTDNTCFLKGNSSTGYLLNGFASEDNTLFIKVTAGNEGRSSHWAIGVGVAVPLGVLIIAAGLVAWLLRSRRTKGSTEENYSCVPFNWGRRHRRHEVEGPEYEMCGLRFFRYEELLHATCNFSETLGEGGFGIVYRGWVELSQEGTIGRALQPAAYAGDNKRKIALAVKVLKVRDQHGAGANEDAELRTLGKIHHINLVSLLGYSIKRGRAGDQPERLLVYEYMGNGSLDRFLSTDLTKQLTWGVRYSIAIGAARGIAYLHHECSPPILHCDIKPHNILLDANFTAKVADFGFARRFHGDSHISMSGIRGTRGYLAPEWLSTQVELTSKLDVFSFGVLVLELVRGFKEVDHRSVPLIDWVIQCISSGEVTVPELDEDDKPLHDAMDEAGTSISSCISVQEQEASEKLRVLKVGMWCVQHNPSMRPPMSRVVQMMEGTLSVENPPIPRSATYGMFSSSAQYGRSDSQSSHSLGSSTVGDMSYSLLSAR